MWVETALPRVETDRLILRTPTANDVPNLLQFYRENESYLAPWSPIFPPDFFTEEYLSRLVDTYASEFALGTAVRFCLFPKDGAGKVIGAINYTQIFRRAAQFCYLGFSLAEAEQGKGYMTEAARATIDFMFTKMNLHRIMANYLPHNARSGALLKRLNFEQEGYARKYLLINGEWQDHILTSLTNPHWREQ